MQIKIQIVDTHEAFTTRAAIDFQAFMNWENQTLPTTYNLQPTTYNLQLIIYRYSQRLDVRFFLPNNVFLCD